MFYESGMKPTLLIVTDLGLFKAYRLETTPRGTPHLTELATIRLEEAHRRLVDSLTDLAGQRGKPTQKQWGAPTADDHNLRTEIKRRLVRKIARHVQHLAQHADGDPVWLVAHREISHAIVNELPLATQRRVERVIPVDLVKAPKAKLLKTLEEAVPV